ncbi:GNAT family N-acetyltransferase [Desulfosediminicola flagellatus]|uniref:GNAT family N-acetyltransferase n=1 Tax=Desulfosediminicola flagellatus TaxID=2569541 RepID=UPI0010AD8D44|nr:GNAT family N-acetyltransferase [Desulfosediminicola flagellatus]
MTIREAIIDEHELLTDISFKSKSYWNYPSSYFDIWKNELTITNNYIAKNNVFALENANQVIGYYSIIFLKSNFQMKNIVLEKGFWLEHMFLLPDFIKQGFGREMISHFKQYCTENNIFKVNVLADPNAKVFYEKMGFKYIEDFPSTIEGRTTPLLEINIKR